jgi:pimeloyl-ACP methyl ester carboxylesterase
MAIALTKEISAFDGTPLAIHRMGEGRPVLLLHGLFSSAWMNWINFGHAQTLADAGFEAIMPDLRAHGESGAPHDPAAYPHDVLVRDVKAAVDALALKDFDLVGFSLGARTAASCVLAGMTPRKLALCGMGLEGLSGWARRGAFFIDAIDRFEKVKQGDPAYLAVSFMRTMKVDRVAARYLLQAVDDIETSDLSRITMPTAVICGDKDRDNGSPQDLAMALSDGRYREIPGTHMSCVTKPDFGQAIARFLSE